jgi:hypothetical protein
MAKGKRQEAEEEGRLPGYFSRSSNLTYLATAIFL